MSTALVSVRMLSAVHIPGRQPPQPGEIVQISASVARDLIGSGRARLASESEISRAPDAPASDAGDRKVATLKLRKSGAH